LDAAISGTAIATDHAAFRQAEVRDFDVDVVGGADKENVFRLQVAMDDTLGVQVLHGLKQLLHQELRVRFGIMLLLKDPFEQLSSTSIYGWNCLRSSCPMILLSRRLIFPWILDFACDDRSRFYFLGI
jgi:hypothetical protein